MASIKAGRYTVAEVLRAADFDFESKAAAEYNDGAPDYRRVKVGGLPFDNLDEELVVPVTADELVITLDGAEDVKLDVELDEDQEEERRRSFESSALEDPNA